MSIDNRGDGLRLNQKRSSNLVPLAGVAGLTLLVFGLWRVMAARQSSPSPIVPAQTISAPVPRRTPRATPTPQIYASRDIANWAKGKKVLQVPVKASDKVFALTFDDGPWPVYTRKILQILKENNVEATFFMVGHEVRARPDVARAVRDAGHAIGNHSWDHPSRPRDPIMQVMRTDAIIQKELGFRPTFFRPPYGLMKNGMAGQAMKLHDPVLLWSADSTDWKKPGAARIVSNVVNEASPGGISLMHDGGGDRYQDVEALPIIISTLRSQGYRFVTIPELLKLRDANAAAQEATHKTARHNYKKKAKH